MHKFSAADGAQLAFRDEGQGLPLLALAGLSRDSRDFDYLSRHLPRGIRLLRLDSRGRGQSDWTGPSTYTFAQETADVLALLDHLEIEQAAIVGSSRGGLLAMLIAATQKHRLLGVCLNDVGPVLERAGLERIGTYLGHSPTVTTLEEVADRMPSAMPGFTRVSDMRWAEETVRHFVQLDGRVGLTYDPALRVSFDAAMAAPPVDAWPLFNACVGMPLALIRGANSDVLSRSTAEAMLARDPNLNLVEVPCRGHVPFLDEPQALNGIKVWLGQVASFEHSTLLAHTDMTG